MMRDTKANDRICDDRLNHCNNASGALALQLPVPRPLLPLLPAPISLKRPHRKARTRQPPPPRALQLPVPCPLLPLLPAAISLKRPHRKARTRQLAQP